MDALLHAMSAQSATEWIAMLAGLTYGILAVFQRPLCWLFGILSCALIAYHDFTQYLLFADGILQILYVLLGVAGLYYWVFPRNEGQPLRVRTWGWQRHLGIIGTSVLISIPLAYLLRHYTTATYTFLDTLTTVLSLYATWMVVQKVLENWLYWIVIDAIYVYLFFQRGGDLVAFLYAAYLIIATAGFYQWRRDLTRS